MEVRSFLFFELYVAASRLIAVDFGAKARRVFFDGYKPFKNPSFLVLFPDLPYALSQDRISAANEALTTIFLVVCSISILLILLLSTIWLSLSSLAIVIIFS